MKRKLFKIQNLSVHAMVLFIVSILNSSCNTESNPDEQNLGQNSEVLNFVGIQSISDLSSSKLKINWQPVIWAIGYEIYEYTPAEDKKRLIATVSGNHKDYWINALSPATEYHFIVHARDFYGNLDNNTNIVSASTTLRPRRIIDIAGARGAFCSRSHLDRKVKCWGRGELVLNGSNDRGDVPEELGNAIPFLQILSGVEVANRIYSGPENFCLVTSIPGLPLRCFGHNDIGQLGTETSGNDIDTQPEFLSSPNTWLGSDEIVQNVAIGLKHICAIINGGQVKCWGENDLGQLGLGSTQRYGALMGEMGDNLPFVNLPPNTSAIGIAAGNSHTCVLLDDNTVRCWGENNTGQLGLGHTNIVGTIPSHMGAALQPVAFSAVETPRDIVANGDSTCAIFNSGRTSCWGSNARGKLGYGHTRHLGDDPSDISGGLPVHTYPKGTTVGRIAGHKTGFCVLSSDYQIRCWGQNNKGQLGVETRSKVIDSATTQPVNIPNSSYFIGLNSNSFEDSVCGVLQDQSVVCWGDNQFGQLGQGDTISRGGQPGDMQPIPPIVNLGDFIPPTSGEHNGFTLGGLITDNGTPLNAPWDLASQGFTSQSVFAGALNYHELKFNSATISWASSPDAVGYVLFHMVNDEPVYLRFVGADVNAATLHDLTPQTQYNIRVNLVDRDGLMDSNTNTLSFQTPAMPNSVCPEGYLQVGANSSLGVGAFCIMKYEAKMFMGKVRSVPNGFPIVNVDAMGAYNYCDTIQQDNYSGTFSLVSNREWMAVAREIESKDNNWSGDMVGTGTLSRGWSASSDSDGFVNTSVAPRTGMDCLYNSAANECSETGAHELKRTALLASGEEIWDFAGHVWEWVDWSDSAGFDYAPVITPGHAWKEFAKTIPSPLIAEDILPNDEYNSVQGVGKWIGGTGRSVRRGGGYSSGDHSGIYAFAASFAATDQTSMRGFRCVYRP